MWSEYNFYQKLGGTESKQNMSPYFDKVKLILRILTTSYILNENKDDVITVYTLSKLALLRTVSVMLTTAKSVKCYFNGCLDFTEHGHTGIEMKRFQN